MDPMSLATTAASAVGAYLMKIATGLVDRAANEAEDQLYQFVSSRLQKNLVGTKSLQRLQKAPGNDERRGAVALALADEIGRDPQFGTALANMICVPHSATGSGDGSIVNTGTWDSRRGVVATGNANVDQSRHFRLGTGGIVVALVAALLLVGGVTGVVINANKPTFPELEGSWQYEGSYGSRVVLHVADDRFAVDAFGMLVQLKCSGTIESARGQTYILNSEEGICSRMTLTVVQEGHGLILNDGKGDPVLFVR
jgi:hypothetical protein